VATQTPYAIAIRLEKRISTPAEVRINLATRL
jgi:hypothetical protein